MITTERLKDPRLCDLRELASVALDMPVDEQQAVWDGARKKIEEELGYLPSCLTTLGFNALTSQVMENFGECRNFGIKYDRPRLGSLMVAVARYYLGQLESR